MFRLKYQGLLETKGAARGDMTARSGCSIHGISEQTFYRWKRKHGGMGTSEIMCLREIDSEHARLKRLLVESVFEIDAIRDVLWGNDRLAENGFVGSFYSRVRDECLSINELWSIEHARVVLEVWRIEFSTDHPNSSPGCLTPEQFAASWSAAREGRLR